MQTLYLDVYFLINFTVDSLALYFSASFISIPMKRWSLIVAGALGALYAVFAILVENGFLKIVLTAFFAILITVISTGRISMYRKIKFFFTFLIFETLVGGAVFFGYSILDKYLYKYVDDAGQEAQNRGILIVAIIVLLSIGVFKLFLALFSGSERASSVRVVINEFDSEYEFEAFADSGNLARDPMDLTPVMLIKESFARKCFPADFFTGGLSGENTAYNKKIRIIPISNGGKSVLLYAIRPEAAYVVAKNGKRENIKIIIAIDKEGGTYGGYNALIPTSVIENVVI